MAQTIPFSFLPLMISLCLCFSLLPNLIVAHQTNANGDLFVTNLIEKACRHSLEKKVCIDSLKLMYSGPEGTTCLNRLAERALKGVLDIIMETLYQRDEENTEGESDYNLLFDCAADYFGAKKDIEDALKYLNQDDFAMVAARVNHGNGMVKSCDQKIRNEPGHSQSLLIFKNNSKMFRRLSNFAVVINRLSAATTKH